MNVLSKTIELRNPFFSSKKSAQHRHEVLLRSGCHMLSYGVKKVELFSKEALLYLLNLVFAWKWKKKNYLYKANFPQEAMFFILCHHFFLHSPLFKSCCRTTFEYLSHCWDSASLLERAATAVASQQLTELKFKFGREHSSHVRKIDDKRISIICFRTYLALSLCYIRWYF